jgi:transposase
MRYASGGGLTARDRERRERLRLETARRFEVGEATGEIAASLRVTVRTVQRWRKAWREQGSRGLVSQGPASLPQLGPEQVARLQAGLRRGPAAHGFTDQRWTLVRVRTLICRLFGVSYTIQGVWKLLRRIGWSCQRPARRALERDDQQVEEWKAEAWPRAERPRRTWAPGSASKTRQAARSGRRSCAPGARAG